MQKRKQSHWKGILCATFLLIALPITCPYTANAGPVKFDPWYYQDNADIRFWLPDKFQHCAGSYALTKITGPTIAVTLGLLKEAYDNDHAGGYSIRDIAANLAGVAAALVSNEKFSIFPLYNTKKRVILLQFCMRYSSPRQHVQFPYRAAGAVF